MIDSLVSGSLRAHCVRLHPGEDLVPCVQEAAKHAITSCGAGSAFVLTCVGSLQEVTLRMASATRRQGEAEVNDIKHWKERFEIVSLVGTFAQDGSKHLHLSISDSSGNAFGGHLINAKVFTTVELVLGTAEEIIFDRVMDPETGYRELTISSGTTLLEKQP